MNEDLQSDSCFLLKLISLSRNSKEVLECQQTLSIRDYGNIPAHLSDL